MKPGPPSPWWSPRPPWTEPAAPAGPSTSSPATMPRPFPVVFKPPFSILTWLWLFGCRRPHRRAEQARRGSSAGPPESACVLPGGGRDRRGTSRPSWHTAHGGKHMHVSTGFLLPFFFLTCYLFNPPLYVLSLFLFFFFLRKEKARQSLTGCYYC